MLPIARRCRARQTVKGVSANNKCVTTLYKFGATRRPNIDFIAGMSDVVWMTWTKAVKYSVVALLATLSPQQYIGLSNIRIP